MPTAHHDLSALTPIATEFLVEVRVRRQCVLRVVTSAYGSGADWENEFFSEMVDGWGEMLDHLVTHLDKAIVAMDHHLARRPSTRAAVHPTEHSPSRSERCARRRHAAVCTTVVAAIASAADVSLEVDGTAIPIPAFAWWTLVGAALGVVFARLLRERRRFVVVTTVAAGLSLIPAIAAPDDTATKAVLVGAHLLAAAIIVPTLSRQLTAVNSTAEQGAARSHRVAADPLSWTFAAPRHDSNVRPSD